MATKVKKHDFSVGGEWEYSMSMPDGSDFISYGKYAKIKTPELIETSPNFILRVAEESPGPGDSTGLPHPHIPQKRS